MDCFNKNTKTRISIHRIVTCVLIFFVSVFVLFTFLLSMRRIAAASPVSITVNKSQSTAKDVGSLFDYLNHIQSSGQFNKDADRLSGVLYGDISTAMVNTMRDFNNSLFENFRKGDDRKVGTITVWGDIGYGYHSTGGESGQRKTTSSSPYIRGYLVTKPISHPLAFFGGAVGVNANRVTVADIDQSTTGVAVQLAVFGGAHTHEIIKRTDVVADGYSKIILDRLFVHGALLLQYGSSSVKRKSFFVDDNDKRHGVWHKSKPKSFGFLASTNVGGTFKVGSAFDVSPYVKLDIGIVRADGVDEGLSVTNITAVKVLSKKTVIGRISFGVHSHMFVKDRDIGHMMMVNLYGNIAFNINMGTKRPVTYDTLTVNDNNTAVRKVTVNGAQESLITVAAEVNADVTSDKKFHFLIGAGVECGTNSTIGANGEIGVGYNF